jgi:hypothetical protein
MKGVEADKISGVGQQDDLKKDASSDYRLRLIVNERSNWSPVEKW